MQRADDIQGPYTDIADLVPDDAMTFRDTSVEPGRDYWYRLITQAADGAMLAGPIRVTTGQTVARTQLFTPYEPADGGLVQIRYSLAGSMQTRLEILDVRGRRVKLIDSGIRQPGTYVKTWNRLDDAGGAVARGVYFVNLTEGRENHSEKMVLLNR